MRNEFLLVACGAIAIVILVLAVVMACCEVADAAA